MIFFSKISIGELMQDCQLPAKKSFGTSKHEFIDNKREQFEQYLQVNFIENLIF